jgi:uncharacterized membrane protein YbhN (UPF0104 family)
MASESSPGWQGWLKPVGIGILWGLIGLFLLRAVGQHWIPLTHIDMAQHWGSLLGAGGITLVAHAWGGWVWGWILRAFGEGSISNRWSMGVYLQTTVAKYLPGNVWHFVGRVRAAQRSGIPVEVGVLSVGLEAALMAVAAAVVGILHQIYWGGLALVGLYLLRPRLLNPLLRRLATFKQRTLKQKILKPETLTPDMTGSGGYGPHLQHYPWGILGAEVGFVVLRGLGFGILLADLVPLGWSQWLTVMGSFGLAWGAGLIVPGAPGGIGVFETGILLLLDGSISSPELIVATGLYRLVSIGAEGLGALMAGPVLHKTCYKTLSAPPDALSD